MMKSQRKNLNLCEIVMWNEIKNIVENIAENMLCFIFLTRF